MAKYHSLCEGVNSYISLLAGQMTEDLKEEVEDDLKFETGLEFVYLGLSNQLDIEIL